MAPDGRKIPVNFEPDPKGTLMLDVSLHWLTRAHETNQGKPRYRSHLLDCKALARALHDTRTIKIGPEPDPQLCYKCGEEGHYADACENEDADNARKELVFG